ncbi:hypothetical protein G9A89_002112 [Geosiphon pyriformis]|nr:hypothetical protein G9A89_002112 [Geosiphon pyriformis]
MKKAAKVSGSGDGFKSVLPRKKRRDGVLENGSGGNIVGFKTSDTTESDSIDMKEECLVKETSFDYVKTKKALGKPLGKIDFSISNNENSILLDASLELPPPLKNLVNISVHKFFILDIGLDKMLQVVKKLFSKVNGFGRAFTSSKFVEIIRAMFTSKLSLVQASKKAEKAKIMVNFDLKKSSGHSDWTVVLKKIPIGILTKTVHTALSKFGIIKSINMQLVGLWQKTVVEFGKVEHTDLNHGMHKIFTKPFYYVVSVGGKTCVIDHYLVSYAQARCATVCFDPAELLDAVIETMSVLKEANLHWSYFVSAKCAECKKLGHMLLTCPVGGKKNVSSGASLWKTLLDLDKTGFSLEMKPIPLVSSELSDRFATLECNFTSLTEHIDMLAKRLDTPEPMNQEADIVMSESLGVVTSSETVAGVVVFNSVVILKMKETLNNFLITVISLSAKIDNTGKEQFSFYFHRIKVKREDSPLNLFTSGLKSGYLGAGVVVVMNSFLTRHICKISEVPGQLLSIKLLFKNKLSVSILGLYAEVFSVAQFSQTGDINSLIAKTVNKSSFIILGGNFNEDGFSKCTSFKKCLDFGLVNALGIVKMIDYVLISLNLVNAVVGHGVFGVKEYFDTDHQTVLVLVNIDANKNCWKYNCKGADNIKWAKFKDDTVANAAMLYDNFLVTRMHSDLDAILNSINASVMKFFFLSGSFFDAIWSVLSKVRKSYYSSKMLEVEHVRESKIRSAIDKKMKSFELNKNYTIRSVLEHFFCKVTLDYLVMNDELVLESDLVRTKVNSLEYVFNDVFSDVMCLINFNKMSGVISNLPDGKVAGLFSYKSTETKHSQKYIKVATIGTIRKDHSSIPVRTAYAESDFCNYINAKIDCLLGRTTDTGKLEKQIHQSLLGYSTATTTRAIAETLHIIDTDIKYYVEQQFLQVQQPVKSDPEEYKNESNNLITAQAKFTVNKKPRVLSPTTLLYHQTPQSRIVFNPPPETHWTKSLGEYGSLFGNLNPAASQTEGNPSTWEQPPAQNLAESASPLTEETAILQPIDSSDKGKQPALAPEEHSNTQTPIPLNITSNIPPINRIMAYRNIAKLEKFSAIERNYYTMAQVLNQFIKGLWSSILRSVRPRHLTSLQHAITLACDFESAEQEANHTQAVNLAINGTFDINAKITQLSKKLTQKIEGFLTGTTGTYQPPQQRENNNNSRYPQQQSWRSDPHNYYYCQKPEHIAHDCRRKIMD